jgi:hypothetical protein
LERKNTSHFDEAVCKNPLCNKSFLPKTYNAIYCGPECRRLVTNKKLLDKYYFNKEKKTKKRRCITENCDTILSMYNSEEICEKCKTERFIMRLVSWGWNEDKLRDEYR